MSGNDALVKIFFKGDKGEFVEQGSFPTTKSRAYLINDLLMGRVETLIPKAQSRLSETGESPNVETENPLFEMPSTGKIKEFIRSRPGYEFMVEDVVREFAGRDVSKEESIDAGKFISSIRTKVGRIRDEIKEEEGGSWDEDFKGRYKIFKFIRSTSESRNPSMGFEGVEPTQSQPIDRNQDSQET